MSLPLPSRPGTGFPICSFFHIYSGWYRGGLCISENALLRQGQSHYTALCERNTRRNFSRLWPAYSQRLRGDAARVCGESWSHWSLRWVWGIGRQGASAKTHLVQELMPLISHTLPALSFMGVDDNFMKENHAKPGVPMWVFIPQSIIHVASEVTDPFSSL